MNVDAAREKRRKVVTAPMLRPDGSILQTPGTDDKTGLCYEPDADYPQVSESPDRMACLSALQSLGEVARDFPFAEKHHFSAWLAGLLSCVGRRAIEGPCPLFVVNSTSRGTGKTRLVMATSRLAFGVEPSAFSQPGQEEEIRKRITSILNEGDSMVVIDNVTWALGGPSLDTVLTSTTWSDRPLGSSVPVKLPNLATWWATGNNVAFKGDVGRRALEIRLESAMENPEARTEFLHPDLLKWVGQNRARLVVNALTLLRGYVVAGRPSDGPSWGCFDSWSALIPGTIRWLGLDDPLAARVLV